MPYLDNVLADDVGLLLVARLLWGGSLAGDVVGGDGDGRGLRLELKVDTLHGGWDHNLGGGRINWGRGGVDNLHVALRDDGSLDHTTGVSTSTGHGRGGTVRSTLAGGTIVSTIGSNGGGGLHGLGDEEGDGHLLLGLEAGEGRRVDLAGLEDTTAHKTTKTTEATEAEATTASTGRVARVARSLVVSVGKSQTGEDNEELREGNEKDIRVNEDKCKDYVPSCWLGADCFCEPICYCLRGKELDDLLVAEWTTLYTQRDG